MALVAYSDSEGSDSEEQPNALAQRAPPKPAQNQIAAGFAVNKSNPRKIQVSLGSSTATGEIRGTDGEPAPKRVRVGGGGPGGFNAMLPAPRRENEQKPTSSGPARKVFSLKTGAEPGFSREADAELRQLFAEQSPALQQNGTSTTEAPPSTETEPVKTDRQIRFRPLSVARNSNKKKPRSSALTKKSPVHVGRTVLEEPASTATTISNPKPPKVSLFSAGFDLVASDLTGEKVEVGRNTGQQAEDTDEAYEIPTENNRDDTFAAPIQSQSLDTIASDLNLSAADRRRLFGREGKGSNSAINIVNFNTDQEYAANEALRASGEQVQHNPVRGIAAGKHSLKQLVNAASTQKDALEESFAAGKSNKREAGSRYGW